MMSSTFLNVKAGFARRLVEACGTSDVQEVAQKTGVPYHTVRKYLLAERLPPAETLISISDATGVSIHWLLTGRNSKYVAQEGRPEAAERTLAAGNELEQGGFIRDAIIIYALALDFALTDLRIDHTDDMPMLDACAAIRDRAVHSLDPLPVEAARLMREYCNTIITRRSTERPQRKEA
jgi:transcriptional regulator with XRE-family HTH domain